MKPNILLVNDDGFDAKGLRTLEKALEPVANTYICAPRYQKSGESHSLTLNRSLTAKPCDGGWAVYGTPADCVCMGVLELFPGVTFDMVVSGINAGPNMGWDMYYSGTVAAAREGAMHHIKSAAFSLCTFNPDADFTTAAEISVKFIFELLETSFPLHSFINVNVPDIPKEEIKGILRTRQGNRRFDTEIASKDDPYGGKVYWIIGDEFREKDLIIDAAAVQAGYVSVTAAKIDTTDLDFPLDYKEYENEN